MIECLVGMFVLVVIFVGAYALLLQSQYLARATAHHAHALQIGRSNLEALRKRVGYEDDALSTGTHTGLVWAVPQIYSIGDDVVYIEYRPSYTVGKTNLGGGVSYKEIEFEVRWDEKSLTGYNEHVMVMNTIISSSLDR